MARTVPGRAVSDGYPRRSDSLRSPLNEVSLAADERVNPEKLLRKALASPNNFRFSEARTLAEAFGFRLSRVNGSHHIFVHAAIPELLNLQEVRGQAKPYQIRQLLQLVERHNLGLGGTS